MGSIRTPLPPLDTGAAEAFWERYLTATDAAADDAYTDLACFGDSVELANELIDLVLIGQKRATASSAYEIEHEGTTVPRVGDKWIACDGTGTPRALIETTEVREGPLSSVDEQFAWDEGEGERTRDDWLRMHIGYYKRTFATAGLRFHEDIPVIFERFTVPYQE